MTLNELVLRYPDVHYEISDGKKHLARITMEYNIVGPPDAITSFLEELDGEWPFCKQRCRSTGPHSWQVQAEYLVRPDAAEEFVKRVSYRGKNIARML